MTPAPSLTEVPVFFPSGEDTLFGVITDPRTPGDLAVIELGGGYTPSTSIGRNGIFVTLARRAASLGFTVLRFDYHGIGESTGRSTIRLDRPFVVDLLSAAEVIRGRGSKEMVLVGSCFGARTAMAGGGKVDGIAGAVLLAPPLRDYALSERRTEGWSARQYLDALIHPRSLVGKGDALTIRRYLRFLRSGARVVFRRLGRAIRPRRDVPRWMSDAFIRGMEDLVATGIPILLVYGTNDDSLPDFEEARRGKLGTVIDRGGSSVTVQILPGAVHGFNDAAAQSRVIDTVDSWLQDTIRNAQGADTVRRAHI